MVRRRQEDAMAQDVAADAEPMPLECFACPNVECDSFNRFGAGNLSVCERMGKGKSIRRLYCSHCQRRFSERQGSLMRHAKLPVATVVRMVKCLAHGCSMEATADICEVDPRTVARLLDRSGPRAEAFHRQALARLERPPAAVEMDELHGRVARPPTAAGKKGDPDPMRPSPPASGATTTMAAVAAGVVGAVARWAATGFTPRWPRSRGS
jgi:transposase-like protein